MRVAGIIRDSLVNGAGIRDVLFLQGCPHHCFNCQNRQTWDFRAGKEWLAADLAELFKDSPNDITISGGEPFSQWTGVVSFMYFVRVHNPTKRFWIYTGYQYDDVKWIAENYLLPYVDVIVDGKYVEALKGTDCLYRGSSNQRLIDLYKSVKQQKIVLWEDSNEIQTQF